MLTATYSLIALSNEQNAVRRLLRKAQQAIGTAWRQLQQTDSTCFGSIVDQLTRFDALCRARKLEQYVIPAVRRVTREADRLLAELDGLSATAAEILRSVGERLSRKEADVVALRDDMCGALDLYCRKMASRLAREDGELFPVVQRVLSTEEWFAIAEQFLSEDKRTVTRNRRPAYFNPSPMHAERLRTHDR